MLWRAISRMANSAQSVAGPSKAVEARTALWPLSYRIQLVRPRTFSLQSHGLENDRTPPPKWWSHTLYRGPGDKEVEVLYSKTKAESEVIAQHFLKEPIIGFDMEWPWSSWQKDTLQNKIGLIQVASEDKIALFHIGLHPGKTTEDIIAPTLRKIIEDPTIGKVGVHILGADFSRLRRFFGLKPKGAIESSHLYRLVKYGQRRPELVSVKLVKMATQVEDQLGLPLFKGDDVRTSNWSKPLSKDQITYAAGDAYAGFMLYKCMNAKRLAMNPTPPLPVHADKYPCKPASRDDPILLDVGDGTVITSEAFFGVKPAKSVSARTTTSAVVKKTVPRQAFSDPTSQALYDELAARRALIAEAAKVYAWRIIANPILERIVRERPCDKESLRAIKGIGKMQEEKYGDIWIEIITRFMAAHGLEPPAKPEPAKDPDTTKKAAQPQARQQKTTPNSSPAFDTPPPRTPHLHTGLSFNMSEFKLSQKEKAQEEEDSPSYDSDSSLPSLDFGTHLDRRTSSGTKRKRAPDSPTKLPNKADKSPVDAKVSPSKDSDILTSLLLAHAEDVVTPSRAPAQNTQFPTIPTNAKALEIRIARNKLLAFSKLAASKLPARPASAPALISSDTLDRIVAARPQTRAEVERIAGIEDLQRACEKTGMDMVKNVVKFVGVRGNNE